ncbi:hypothetical protein MP638_007484 [Amoeboaphelidium occidentale]|nr:hypothetical protein MP638_007484 [Amoeboaphelidium occidentale]
MSLITLRHGCPKLKLVILLLLALAVLLESWYMISSGSWAETETNPTINYPKTQEEWNAFRQDTAHKARMVNRMNSNDPKVAFKSVPITYECDRNNLERLGDQEDGGKWVCKDFFANKESITVFSVGSNGDFSYEAAVLKMQNGKAKIHTFDCTGVWEPPYQAISFHNWCLFYKDIETGNYTTKAWGTILQELDIKRVDLLKLDIEGYEWSILHSMLRHPKLEELPKQINLELHNALPGGIYKKINDNSLYNRVQKLFTLFDDAGYYVASSEFNIYSDQPCCSEFTLIRP